MDAPGHGVPAVARLRHVGSRRRPSRCRQAPRP